MIHRSLITPRELGFWVSNSHRDSYFDILLTNQNTFQEDGLRISIILWGRWIFGAQKESFSSNSYVGAAYYCKGHLALASDSFRLRLRYQSA